MNTGFDPQLYMELQTKYIRERIERFDNKLYLEFGGKLFDDFHAARVLPGFESDAKIKLLLELKDITELIFTIAAPAIEKNKVRADIGITYDMDLLRLIQSIPGWASTSIPWSSPSIPTRLRLSFSRTSWNPGVSVPICIA